MLNEFAWREGRILVKDTGAELALEPGLFRDVARHLHFVGEVTLIRAQRELRGRLSRTGAHAVRIGFVPVTPHNWYAIWSVCQLAGLEITRDPAKADILFYFEDRNRASSPLPDSHYVINRQCTDIRKSRVAEVFEEVFGYTLGVDPESHHGLALRKSEGNGVHDGEIVPCPACVPRRDLVYQRLIDNSLDGRTFIDIRTPVAGGDIPVVYLKHRRVGSRFSNDNDKVTLTSAAEQYSDEERRQVLAFAHRMGLEFGGLDVLRDRKDGRLYIVDVNKTDMGPPTALPQADKIRAMEALAGAFRKYVDDRLAGHGAA